MDAATIGALLGGGAAAGVGALKGLERLARGRNGNGHHAPCPTLTELVDKVQGHGELLAKLVAHREDDVKSQARIEQTLVGMAVTMTEAKDAAHQAAKDAAITAATVAAQAHRDATL